MNIVYIILFLMAALLLVLVLRTLLFRPKAQPRAEEGSVDFDGAAAAAALQTLLRFRTVSNADPALEDEQQFEGFMQALPKLFPNLHSYCGLQRFEGRALLYRWQGKSSARPAVMMAHYDVVPAMESCWEKPPFEGVIEDGVIWGRGALDTKGSLTAALFAAETLIARGFVPERDVYFAFSGGEEVNGPGAANIVEYFRRNGIEPELVLDEGGAVVENVFPGLNKACGLIGIAEKGMMNLRLSVSGQGGHAGAPKPGGPLTLLSRACLKIERRAFKMHITEPVTAMFDTLGRHCSFAYRMIFANLWLFGGVLDILGRRSGGDMNALLRTTVAFTQAQGSPAPNVIPPQAHMLANIRLNPADSVESALAYLSDVVDDSRVQLSVEHSQQPGRISLCRGEGWDKLSRSVASTWPGCIVSPYLMVQCSDARHWSEISDRVYRFSAMDLSADERATIHGHNERLRLQALHKAVEFYLRLLEKC